MGEITNCKNVVKGAGSLIEKIKDLYMDFIDPHDMKDYFSKIFQDNYEELTKELTSSQRLELAAEALQKRKLRNLIDIVHRAEQMIDENANAREVNDDWLMDYFSKASNIKTEVLQYLWAQILAEEINHPNSISKRLLHNLYLMRKEDADNFLNFSRFCFYDKIEDLVHPLIFIKNHEGEYRRSRLSTNILNELVQFSLIEVNYDVGFSFSGRKYLIYTNHSIKVEAERIPVGNVRLTSDGQELFKIIDKRNDDQVLEFTIQQLQYRNVKVTVEHR